MKPDSTLAAEIRELGRMDGPDRNGKLRAGAASLEEVTVDGLSAFLKKHGRAVAAVVVAGTMLCEPYRHSSTAIKWAMTVKEIYGAEIRAVANPRFHITYLWDFIAPMAKLASEA